MNQAQALMGVYPLINHTEVLIEEKVLLKSENGTPCVVMGHFYEKNKMFQLPYTTRIVPTKEFQYDLMFTAEANYGCEDSMRYCAAKDAAQAVVQITQGVNPDFKFNEW